jgi:NADP-dependent 3-hydroxy acid dehydrogenase YdfG
MADLDGRVAVVTGAARGIGLGIAERLSAGGAAVVVADIDGATAEKGAKTLPGRAIAVEHDVRDGESSKRLREKALDAFGRVDILVNNAGVGPKPGPVQHTTDEEYDRVMNVNARGLFLTTRAFVQGMIDQKAGRIINISSIVGQTGFAMVLPYVASKFAVTGMTHSLASELAPAQHHGQLDPSRHPGDRPAFGGGGPILQAARPEGGGHLGVVQESHSARSFPDAQGHRRDGCFPGLRSRGKHHRRRLQCRRRLGNALSKHSPA